MKTTEITSSWVHYTFPKEEFLSKLGLPPDTDVIQVRTLFVAGGAFQVVAKKGNSDGA